MTKDTLTVLADGGVFVAANGVAASRVSVAITDLEDTVNGDPLDFAYARDGIDTVGTVAVESLTWKEAEVGNDGAVKFSSSADVTVAIDSLSGKQNYCPAHGGGETGADTVRYFNRADPSTDGLRIKRSASVFWVLNIGTATDGVNFGALTFKGINASNVQDVDPTTTSGATFDTAKAAFEAGQESLAYPTHVVSSFSIETSGGASRNEAFILLFKDGPTFHYHGWTDHNADFIDSATEAASAYRSAHFEGNPLLSANDNELLFSEYGQSFTKAFPTMDGDNNEIGVGGPTGGAAALAACWFRDNPQYVNVPTGDMTARDSKLEGMFVGQGQDGPLGIIGTWELTGGAFGIGDSTQDVRGAFGADIQP